MKTRIMLSFVAVVGLNSLQAVEFKPVGFKAVGLGGAGVASTRGSLAGYYNPALLKFSDHTTELSANVGVRLRESNLIDNMDTLHKVDIQGTLSTIGNDINNTMNSTTINNLKTAQNILANIGTDNALQVSAMPSLTAQISDAFAVGIYANVDVGMKLNMDKNYLEIIVKDDNSNVYAKFDPNNTNVNNGYSSSSQAEYEAHSLQYGIDNEKHYIKVDAMALVELPLSLAKSYDLNNGTWSVGINLKPMSLTTYSQKIKLGESSDSAENGSDSGANETTYKPTIGFDLGVAYRPTNSKVTFGLTGKDLNSPKFKVDRSQTGVTEAFKIDPLVRAGISLPAWNDNIEFAFDADLTKNKALVAGEESQLIGGGFEFHPASWFAFRAGAMQDIASEKFDDGVIVTAGLGFGLKWAQIDLSAQASSKTGQYDGQTIPRYTAVNLSLVSKWGDGYNRKEAPVSKEVVPEVKKEDKPIKTLSPEEQNRIKQESEKAFQELDKSI